MGFNFDTSRLQSAAVPPQEPTQGPLALPLWQSPASAEVTGVSSESEAAGIPFDVNKALENTNFGAQRERGVFQRKVLVVPASTLRKLGSAYDVPLAPYKSWRLWLAAQRRRLALAALPPITPANSREQAERTITQTEEALGRALDRAWEDSRFDARAAGALQAGATMGQQFGEAFAQFGPVGQGVGYAIGFVAGLVTGFLPLASWDVQGAWGSLVAAFTPGERYLLWSRLDRLMDAERAKSGKPRLPPGLLREPHVFYTAWGGADATALFCAEILAQHDWCPDAGPPREGGLDAQNPLALYALQVVAAHAGDEEPWTAGYAGDRLKSGQGPQWLRAYEPRFRDLTAGAVRAANRAKGTLDLDPAPITPEVEAALDQAQQEIAARAEARNAR